MANSLPFLFILCLLLLANSVRCSKLTYAADGLVKMAFMHAKTYNCVHWFITQPRNEHVANLLCCFHFIQQKTWCIAKPSSSDNDLLANLNFACGALRYGNCTQIIGEGGPCYQPNVLLNRASVAMNLYYREFGANWWNCDFKNSGLVTIKDPSYGNCGYA